MSNPDKSVFGKGNPLPGSYGERLAEARRLQAHGNYPGALEILDRLAARLLRLPERRREPENDLWWNLIAVYAMTADVKSDAGDFAGADTLWMQLEQLDPTRRFSWRRARYVRLIGRGEVEEGLRELQALAEEDPDDIKHWLAAAEAALQAGRYGDAETWLQQVERLLDEDEEGESFGKFQMLCYGLYVQQKRWPEALNAWYEAMEFDEDLESYVETPLRVLLAAGQYDLALDLLDDEAFLPALARYYQGWIAQRRGDLVRARYLWRQVAETPEDGTAGALHVKARALCWLGRPQEAIALLLRKVELFNELEAVDALTLALAWGAAGKLTEARANMATALRLADPREPLSALEWYDFDTLITDEEIKAVLRDYFELESEPTGAAETP